MADKFSFHPLDCLARPRLFAPSRACLLTQESRIANLDSYPGCSKKKPGSNGLRKLYQLLCPSHFLADRGELRLGFLPCGVGLVADNDGRAACRLCFDDLAFLVRPANDIDFLSWRFRGGVILLRGLPSIARSGLVGSARNAQEANSPMTI
jgi:hypothetical protein